MPSSNQSQLGAMNLAHMPQMVTPQPMAKPTTVPDPATQELLGRFNGQQMGTDLENCRVQLEVKPKALETGFYNAYETRSCIPSPLFYRGALSAQKAGQMPNIIADAAPVSTSMSGSMNDGAMTFRIDQVVGATAHHCGPRTYSIQPFGTGQIMVQWEEPAPCNKNGHMVLVRTR